LNTQYVTNDKTDLNIRTNIEPIPDLRIELNANRSESFTYQSNFKYNPTLNRYDLLNAQTTGSYTMSYISIQTAFSNIDKKTSESEVFKKFESSRVLMSQVLGQENPNSLGDTSGTGFYDGYGKAQQDVLIPTFLAVYSGRTPGKSDQNYFIDIPLPNYSVRYTGLTRNPHIADIFSNVTVNHSYKSTYSINGFQSLINYKERNGAVESRDLVGNFLPRFQTQQVTIAEQFSPFIGFDTRLKNNLGFNLEYRKGRNLGLSVSNGQISEQRDNGIRISFNYRTENLKIPLKLNKEQVVFKNNLNFICNITINDTRTIVHRVDVANGSQTIGGNYVLNVQPSIDYVINQKLNLRLFVDRRMTKPYTSQSFKVSSTNVGFALRFTLGV
jgi:cell surface protein SprA